MTRKPRIVITLRPQDTIPNWISHIALVDGDQVHTGSIDTVLQILEQRPDDGNIQAKVDIVSQTQRKSIIELKNVNVKYHERHVWILR